MVDIFTYQNYREYLRDYYNEQKRLKRNFSYRAFAKKAGINASAFLYYVIRGQRNLTKSSASQITKAIGMTLREEEFFENLVSFNQSKTILEKTKYYNRLLKSQIPKKIEKVKRDNFEYYSNWYHSVIRELVTLIDFKGDYQFLGTCTLPAITAREAQKSVALLEKLEFISKNENGRYELANPVIATWSTGSEVFVIEKFQQEMLELARQSFASFSKVERMNASTTLKISKSTFEFFKTKTREFRAELLELARLDQNPEEVYQFTFNLFPVGRVNAKS